MCFFVVVMVTLVQSNLSTTATLGTDHLTLEGGGGGDFWSSRVYFSSNLVGRIFFSLFFR